MEKASPVSGPRYWTGDLRPYEEDGVAVRERYGTTSAVLLVDDGMDYYRFSRFPLEREIEQFYDAVYPATRRDNWYNAAQQYLPSRWSSVVRRIGELGAAVGFSHEQLRVHDAGCGFGGLVSVLRERGVEATGTDLSSEAIEGGRTQRSNVWIHHGRAERYLRTAPPQHVIVVNHMIEHSTDPYALVQALGTYLVPGGFLLVRCPNSQFLRSRRISIRANWYGYPKHLHYFGPRSLRILLEMTGLEPVVVRCTDTDMTIDGEVELLDEISTSSGSSMTGDALVRHLVDTLQAKELEAVGRKDPASPSRPEISPRDGQERG